MNNAQTNMLAFLRSQFKMGTHHRLESLVFAFARETKECVILSVERDAIKDSILALVKAMPGEFCFLDNRAQEIVFLPGLSPQKALDVRLEAIERTFAKKIREIRKAA